MNWKCAFGPPRVALFSLIFAALFFQPFPAGAQSPPVPSEFQDLYSSLGTYLTNFNATLNVKSAYAGLATLNVANADANVGPQLVNSASFNGIQLQVQAIKAVGAKAAMVEVGFPMLYEPFLTSQGQSYAQFVAFYQQVAALVRAQGLKLVVENNTLLTGDVQSGWDVGPFYATLNWTQYQQARAQTAVNIAQAMQPDYMVVLQEPDTEANASGQSNVNTVAGAASLLSQILASLAQSPVPGMQVGAGVGSWLNGFQGFVQNFVTQPLNFIDLHVYPVNLAYLPNALAIASTAASAGLPLTVTESWLHKVRDSELSTLTLQQTRARNPFSFWAPLDAQFIQTMQNLGTYTHMAFLTTFDTSYFSAYLPYDSTMNLSIAAILGQETAQASQNTLAAMFTSTAMSYYNLQVAPPDTTPPSVPAGLTAASGNPANMALNWSASTDNVGVAGYYVLRNGGVVGTTAALNYVDTGLSEATTYTYTVEAFDLGGNISAPSLPVHGTTADVTPPTVPTNLTAAASSCQKVTLNWSASTDKISVSYYIVFWGMSPAALSQAGMTSSTSYISYPLTCGTTYYYAVEAVDKSGNTSTMSPAISITTPMPPSPPASLSATPLSVTAVSLGWPAAASGGLAVQYYYIFRGATCASLAQLAIVSKTSYTDATVTSGTSYCYGVEASDTGGDKSMMSPPATIVVPSLPSVPTNVVGTPATVSNVNITWSASASGGLPIANYRVLRGSSASNLVQIGVALATSYWDSTATAGATYYYAVEAADSAADLSPMSAIVQVNVPRLPSAPANVAATPASTSKVNITFSASASGGLPIANYRILRGSTPAGVSQIAVSLTTSYWDATVVAGTTYYYAVQAADSGADLSPMSAAVQVNVPTLPSTPANVAATPASTSKVNITFSASTSGGLPIANYRILRGSTPAGVTQIAVSLSPSYWDATVAAGTTYYYAVQAADSGADLSPMSAVVRVNVPNPPSAPTNVAASAASTSKVNVTFSASTSGGLPIANYRILRGSSPSSLVQVAVVTTSYWDLSVTAGTIYYYAVEAADTGADLSPMSAVVAVTVPTAPTAPSNVAGTAVSTTKISLSWSPSASGGLPVQYYHVYRGTSPSAMTALAVVSQPSYSDASLAPSTTYYYSVQSNDSGGDYSPMSATAAATTLALPQSPNNLSGTAVTKTQISLTWTAGKSGMPLVSNTINRGTSPSSLTPLKTIGTATTFTDYPVTAGTTYYYAVQAKDSGGNLSPMSSIASVTTLH